MVNQGHPVPQLFLQERRAANTSLFLLDLLRQYPNCGRLPCVRHSTLAWPQWVGRLALVSKPLYMSFERLKVVILAAAYDLS
jgi:hypothetical protein